MNFDPASLTDSRIHQAFTYWDSLRNGREIPARSDIDPSEIIRILPFVLLVDVFYDPMDFRIRLAGTDIVERFGQEITGCRLQDIDFDGKHEQVFREYSLTVEQRQPLLFTEEFRRHDGKYMNYSRLLCPLSRNGDRIDMLFGVQVPQPGTPDTRTPAAPAP